MHQWFIADLALNVVNIFVLIDVWEGAKRGKCFLLISPAHFKKIVVGSYAIIEDITRRHTGCLRKMQGLVSGVGIRKPEVLVSGSQEFDRLIWIVLESIRIDYS